jgi:gamma-glutamylcyclotransferase (GGCT)/AIG2-like uncharacterized protein YtfP
MNPMKNNKLAVYGILKKGYELDLDNYGAKFIGEGHIQGATLFGIGPMGSGKFHGVGLRLTDDKSVAHIELWEIPDSLWDWLDGIEGNGFCYTRKIVEVKLNRSPEVIAAGCVGSTDAWVYEHCYKDFKYTDKIESGRF